MELPAEYTFQLMDEKGNIHAIAINSIYIETFDDSQYDTVRARIKGFTKLLTLWQGLEYKQMGDYTQKQIEDRVLELLQPDIKKSLWNLSTRFLPYEETPPA